MKSDFLKIPLKSFHDFNFYKEVIFEWKGTNLFYILVLVAICWLPIAFRLHFTFNDFAEKYAPELIGQIPEISFSEGLAKSSNELPVYVKNSDTGEIIGLIDTKNKAGTIENQQKFSFILNSDSITIQNKYGSYQTWQISQLGIDGLTLNQTVLEDWISFSKKYFVPFLFPFAVFLTFAFRMLQIFIYSAMIMLLSGLSRTGLKFENAFRLATVAITPGLIFKAVLEALGLSFQFDEAVMSIVTLALSAAAIKNIKKSLPEAES